ncbi:MAG: hypothetical protein ACLGHN_14395 [Bacteriovoracia bacterium]
MCRTQTTLEEMQNSSDVFEELLIEMDFQKEKEMKRGKVLGFHSHSGQCPRCDSNARISSGHLYCPECNWDSMTELRLESDKWAA